AADIGSCGDHDWLERQPDETLDCFSGSGGCISQHKLANSSSCADAAIAGLQSESATRVSGLPFRLFDHNSKARHCPSADEPEAIFIDCQAPFHGVSMIPTSIACSRK